MAIESTVKRIGGSLFARIPPDVAKRMGLTDGGRVLIELRPLGGSADEVLALFGRHPLRGGYDRRELWGEYGERV